MGIVIFFLADMRVIAPLRSPTTKYAGICAAIALFNFDRVSFGLTDKRQPQKYSQGFHSQDRSPSVRKKKHEKKYVLVYPT